MKYLNAIFIAMMMVSLMACPLLDPPPGLPPLSTGKTSNSDYKLTRQRCRVLSDPDFTYQYDAAGRLVSEAGSYSSNFTYDANGLLKKVNYDFGFKGELLFEYDQNNLFKSVVRGSEGAPFKRLNKYANGVYLGQDNVRTSTGQVLSSFAANGVGQVVSSSVGESFVYDANGNLIKYTSSAGTITYEYDNKINPANIAHGNTKGQGSVLNHSIRALINGGSYETSASANNITKITTSSITINYEYTYNSNNLPITRKNLTNGTVGIYKYENCE